jgi:hypothetical protein
MESNMNTERKMYTGPGMAGYNPKWHKQSDDYKPWPRAKIMWATEAYHQIADISRSNGGWCSIHGEEKDCYRGHWITGYGYVDVVFPKKTTRKCTKEEKERCMRGFFSEPQGNNWKAKEEMFA